MRKVQLHLIFVLLALGLNTVLAKPVSSDLAQLAATRLSVCAATKIAAALSRFARETTAASARGEGEWPACSIAIWRRP